MNINFDTCPSCRQRIFEGATRCLVCNAILQTPDERAAAIQKLKESKKKFDMGKLLEVIKIKKIVIIPAMCLLILASVLYPSVRYETTSVGNTHIRYDRFKDVIYMKNALAGNAEWIRTEHKNIKEAKYRLAEKELEAVIEEARKGIQQKQRKRSFDETVRYY